jgi:hypothetical protein
MGTTDERADDLSDCFNFFRVHPHFRHISAPLGPQYFRTLHHAKDDLPDTDY